MKCDLAVFDDFFFDQSGFAGAGRWGAFTFDRGRAFVCVAKCVVFASIIERFHAAGAADFAVAVSSNVDVG